MAQDFYEVLKKQRAPPPAGLCCLVEEDNTLPSVSCEDSAFFPRAFSEPNAPVDADRRCREDCDDHHPEDELSTGRERHCGRAHFARDVHQLGQLEERDHVLCDRHHLVARFLCDDARKLQKSTHNEGPQGAAPAVCNVLNCCEMQHYSEEEQIG